METEAMITQARGNLLEADADALVNTVNTVGIMGKGIALQFKRAFPAMFKDYARACKDGRVELGRMHVWHTGELRGPQIVINFPTKGHWRSKSRIEDVDAGLDDLVRVIRAEEIGSIAIPPLGCGHGGLEWAQVEPLIRAKLAALPDVDVQLFAPEGAPAAAEMASRGEAPRITRSRAAVVAAIARYSSVSLEGATPIAIQKLMYFLQASGFGLGLSFEKHHYGPYADAVRAILRELEGHQLRGFGDGSQRVELAEPITVIDDSGVVEKLTDDDMASFGDHLDHLMALVEGFESTFSLELLATVHWVATHPSAGTDPSDEAIVDAVRNWSSRKGGLFQPDHVRVALRALREGGWLQPAPAMA